MNQTVALGEGASVKQNESAAKPGVATDENEAEVILAKKALSEAQAVPLQM